MPQSRIVKLDEPVAERGRRRLIRYIDEGRAPTVPDYLCTELRHYHVTNYRDRALETFERVCEFCGLPSPEELDDERKKNDFEPPIHRLDASLVRIHVKPVIEAFPMKETS